MQLLNGERRLGYNLAFRVCHCSYLTHTLADLYIHSLLFIVLLGDFEFCKYFIEVFISIMPN